MSVAIQRPSVPPSVAGPVALKARRLLAAAAVPGNPLAVSPLLVTRSVADGVTTSGSVVVTSATAAFTRADIGRGISGAGIPAGATIASLNSSSSANISIASGATATATAVALTIVGDVTITFTANTSTPTIASAVRYAPKASGNTGSPVDVANDPHFTYTGGAPGKLTIADTDMARPDYLTGGNSQQARWSPRIGAWITAQASEWYLRFPSASCPWRLRIDGLPTTLAFNPQTVTAGQRGILKVDFGSVQSHHIEVEVVDPEFGGVWVGPTDSVTRARPPKLSLGVLGDSHVGGANGVSRHDTYPRIAATLLNVDWINLGIGGSGYLNDNGTTGANYINRVGDATAAAPDILVVEGSWNDDPSSTSTQIAAAAATLFAQLKAALPNTLLIAAGPWITSHNVSATKDAFDVALRAQAQAAGWHGYISYRDPLNLVSSAPAWAVSTVYVVGQPVLANGLVWLCTSSHTSASTGTIDVTKFKSTAIVHGTGKVGTTAGNGNADVIVSSDGIHCTFLGHDVKARWVAAELQRIAAAIASGLTWAG